MSKRSMSASFLSKLFSSIAVLVLIASSLWGGIPSPADSLEWWLSAAFPWFMISSVFAILASITARRNVGKIQIREDDTAQDPDRDFILLLRPFSVDKSMKVRNPHTILRTFFERKG